jgi:LemA protein
MLRNQHVFLIRCGLCNYRCVPTAPSNQLSTSLDLFTSFVGRDMLVLTQLLNSKKSHRGLGAAAIVLIALVAVLALSGIWFAGGYNHLVGLDTNVQERASNIDSQNKRRADLIPNLVATVKGYAKHESGVYKDIAEARSRLLSANTQSNPKEAASANASFNSSLGRLLALAESYPNLKADKNFTALQDELAGTENRLNTARIEYNDAVKSYNTSIRLFPDSIIAGFTGFKQHAFFEASETEKATPKVEF